MRVLLVDDEKELISTLSERLSYRGVDSNWVTSAKEAMSKAERRLQYGHTGYQNA